MKQTFSKLASLAAFALLFASCEEPFLPEEEGTSGGKVTLTLNTSATKTVLNNDKSVLWEDGDHVTINGFSYEVTVDSNDSTKATVRNVDESSEGYYASYPYSYLEGNDISFYLYGSQYYREGSFDMGCNPMVAYSDDQNLSFRNVASVIKFGITGDGQVLSKLMVTGNDNEIMAGEMIYSKDDIKAGNLDKYRFSDEPYDIANTITVFFEDSLALSATPKYVYVVVPARTYAKGFTVTMIDTEGAICRKSTDKSFEALRSDIKQMATVGFEANSDELSITGITPSASSVSFNVNGVPGNKVGVYAVTKRYWDYMKRNWIDLDNEYETEEDMAADFFPDLFESVLCEIGTSGTGRGTVSESMYGDAYGFLIPGEEYVLWAVYALDEWTTFGEWKSYTFTTTEATGPAPTLTVTRMKPDVEGTAKFHIETDGKAFRYMDGSLEWFEEYFEDSKVDIGITTEEEFILHCAYVLWEGEDDYDQFMKEKTISTGKTFNGSREVFVAAVISEGGQVTIEKVVYDTEYYADETWTVVSTNGVFDCGVFTHWWDNNLLIKGLTVEKAEGKDLFRVKNLFSTSKTYAIQSMGFTGLEGDYYTYFDATDPEGVRVDAFANDMGLTKDQYTYNFGDMYYDIYESSSFNGTYDADKGIIYISDASIYNRVGYDYNYNWTSNSVLYFDLADNSMDIEDFEMETEKTPW